MMIHYKDSKGKVHAFQDEAEKEMFFKPDMILMSEEEVKQHYIPSASDLLRKQIAELEREVTPRRLREGALGLDNGWLKQQHEKITALQKQLGD